MRAGIAFVHQRVERRGADHLQHRVAFGVVGADVAGLERSGSKGIREVAGSHFTRSLILRGVEQRAGFAGVRQLHDDHPAAVGILVDGFRLVLERRVHLDDFAGHRRVELGHGLHRLDRAERLPLLQLRADLRQLDVHDVAELLLRVVGDADLAAVAGELDPLVVFRVFEAG